VTVDLASDVEKFVREQLRSEPSGDASELVNDILRSVGELRQKPFKLSPELEEWLLASADLPATQLNSSDFDGIRERVRTRTATASS
jgi:Arc/MetJ-type ribon-helix-helix transcriptional regulator